MIDTVPDILARIVASKRQEFAPTAILRAEMERRAVQMSSRRRGFREALLRQSPAIIAEIKKASPSKGVLREHFEPCWLAREYEAGGAAAISVLTDQAYFQGSLEHLVAAREAVSIPALRKDFTLDGYHVVEAAANAADAILLIAAILEEKQIREFRELAGQYRMAALVEVHEDRKSVV